jgi:hypothetical protein
MKGPLLSLNSAKAASAPLVWISATARFTKATHSDLVVRGSSAGSAVAAVSSMKSVTGIARNLGRALLIMGGLLSFLIDAGADDDFSFGFRDHSAIGVFQGDGAFHRIGKAVAGPQPGLCSAVWMRLRIYWLPSLSTVSMRFLPGYCEPALTTLRWTARNFLTNCALPSKRRWHAISQFQSPARPIAVNCAWIRRYRWV